MQNNHSITRNLDDINIELRNFINASGGIVSADIAAIANKDKGGISLISTNSLSTNTIIIALPSFLQITRHSVLEHSEITQKLFKQYYSEDWLHDDLILLALGMLDTNMQAISDLFNLYCKSLPRVPEFSSLPFIQFVINKKIDFIEQYNRLLMVNERLAASNRDALIHNFTILCNYA